MLSYEPAYLQERLMSAAASLILVADPNRLDSCFDVLAHFRRIHKDPSTQETAR